VLLQQQQQQQQQQLQLGRMGNRQSTGDAPPPAACASASYHPISPLPDHLPWSGLPTRTTAGNPPCSPFMQGVSTTSPLCCLPLSGHHPRACPVDSISWLVSLLNALLRPSNSIPRLPSLANCKHTACCSSSP
jgi:hypothetical protein